MVEVNPQIVRDTLDGLRTHLQSLAAERERLETKVAGIKKAISYWEGQLSDPQTESGSRRPRGQNLTDVLKALDESPQGALTITDISQRVGIAASSVQAVLLRNEETFRKGPDGLWRKRVTTS
jgi:septal ring factor EnvC (AmiA/AmiB activator)